MKIIKYKMKHGNSFVDVEIGYNETNLAIAEKEAFNGDYTIEENDEPEFVPEASPAELINILLGVI